MIRRLIAATLIALGLAAGGTVPATAAPAGTDVVQWNGGR